jgi:hypothetical protein
VVPHITDAVQDWIERVAHVPVDNSSRVPDVCVIEVGWLAHPPALAHHSRHAAATRADGKQLVPPVLTGTGVECFGDSGPIQGYPKPAPAESPGRYHRRPPNSPGCPLSVLVGGWTQLGGTVGDIESMPFVEALRQFQFRVGKDNFCLIHVSLVPVLGVVGEQKTKPTQHSVQVRTRTCQRAAGGPRGVSEVEAQVTASLVGERESKGQPKEANPKGWFSKYGQTNRLYTLRAGGFKLSACKRAEHKRAPFFHRLTHRLAHPASPLPPAARRNLGGVWAVVAAELVSVTSLGRSTVAPPAAGSAASGRRCGLWGASDAMQRRAKLSDGAAARGGAVGRCCGRWDSPRTFWRAGRRSRWRRARSRSCRSSATCRRSTSSPCTTCPTSGTCRCCCESRCVALQRWKSCESQTIAMVRHGEALMALERGGTTP